MKKIKSSLEIALERMGKVQTNREELEKIDGEKYLKAAASLGSSLLEGKTSREQIGESINRYPQEIRGKVFNTLANRLMEGVALANTEAVLEAIAFLTDNEEIKKICRETLGLFQQHLDQLKEKKAALLENLYPVLKERFAKEGFQGSALAGFNISGTRQWQETAWQFEQDFQALIKSFKDNLIRELARL